MWKFVTYSVWCTIIIINLLQYLHIMSCLVINKLVMIVISGWEGYIGKPEFRRGSISDSMDIIKELSKVLSVKLLLLLI